MNNTNITMSGRKKWIIKLENRVFDGKYQRFYFFLLDMLDAIGKVAPFDIFISIGSNLTFRNFHVDVGRWNKDSTKYQLVSWIDSEQKKRCLK